MLHDFLVYIMHMLPIVFYHVLGRLIATNELIFSIEGVQWLRYNFPWDGIQPQFSGVQL